ncbi:hypothetical protein E2562_023043 [Oryza meyeriana var. granulata]|uniref:Uncharacterized protein n=1 Tax=Oryza meyeriana var. granulata TaxID=110450 RepID=A0A6G1EYM5_9ORYZ|nr:hypothetical protein E2562_023043 [Oryza meyeriana var. granulata]
MTTAAMATAGEPKTRKGEREFDGGRRRDAVTAENRQEGFRAMAWGMKKGTQRASMAVRNGLTEVTEGERRWHRW